MVRWASLVLLLLLGCTDLREFRGAWAGHRVGTAVALHTGITGTTAALSIDRIDGHSFAARIQVEGVLDAPTPISSIPGVEADVLSDLTFTGDPLKVYLSFVPIPDGRGDALLVIALFDDRRIEVRMIRGGTDPLYGIWTLRPEAEAPS
jgi:hypothetical protein